MDTPHREKLTSLLFALIRNPGDALPWASHLPCWGRLPLDLGLPWFSYGAIRYLQNWLKPGHCAFEFGSGGSTVFLARRVRQVYSVENDLGWQKRVAAKLAEENLSNAIVEYHDLVDDSRMAFENSRFSQRIAAQSWDVVVVDCYCGFQAARYGVIRPAAMELARQHTKIGGIVILDDSWMYPEQLAPRPGWEVTDFLGCGPARVGTTSTAVFRRVA